nr:MAG TPA: hypothetical protein [Caudoviricetes sp.]
MHTHMLRALAYARTRTRVYISPNILSYSYSLKYKEKIMENFLKKIFFYLFTIFVKC